MTPSSKSAVSPSDLRGVNMFRVAVVGAASLMGKEVAETLRDRIFPASDIRLLDDDEALGRLEAVGGEMNFIQSVRAQQFEHVDFTFFASDPQATRASWKSARDLGNTIIDLSGALEDEPGASVRSPWIEREIGQAVAPQLQPGPVAVAHPAAIALSLLALRAARAVRVERMIATVLSPVSEYGQQGMDELHEQTVNLLSFQDLPKNVFDVQVAFNMVARYGARSNRSLAAASQRILAHYRRLAPDAVEPSVLLLQAPVFHGHAFAVYLESTTALSVNELSRALAGEHVTIAPPEDSPTNVSVAGQDDILVSLAPDASHKSGVWIWAVIDNLRVAALNAVESAESLTASRPRGHIQ